MKFQYVILVNRLLMDSAPTLQKALAVVSMRWHGTKNVEIQKDNQTIWRAAI